MDSETPAPVDTVLLDVDGTLIDSTYLHTVAWMRAFARHDLTPPWWRVHRTIGMGGDKLVGDVNGAQVERDLGDDLRAEWAEIYRELLPEVTAVPGAADLVGMLSETGYAVALASSGAAEFTDAALETVGLSRDSFAAITTAEDVTDSKPDREVLALALERAGGTRAVVVGDTVWDGRSAARLPAPFVGVRTGGFAEPELAGAGAALVVDDVSDLVARRWRP